MIYTRHLIQSAITYYQQSCELVAVRTLPLDLHKRIYLPFPENYTELDAMGLKFSEWLPVRCAVPQGSLLGPLLFSIFIYDFNYSAGFFSLRLYADDTTQYAAHESPVVLESTLNQDIMKLTQWDSARTARKLMQLKTQAMTPRKSEYIYNLSVEDQTIEIEPTLVKF